MSWSEVNHLIERVARTPATERRSALHHRATFCLFMAGYAGLQVDRWRQRLLELSPHPEDDGAASIEVGRLEEVDSRAFRPAGRVMAERAARRATALARRLDELWWPSGRPSPDDPVETRRAVAALFEQTVANWERVCSSAGFLRDDGTVSRDGSDGLSFYADAAVAYRILDSVGVWLKGPLGADVDHLVVEQFVRFLRLVHELDFPSDIGARAIAATAYAADTLADGDELLAAALRTWTVSDEAAGHVADHRRWLAS